MLIGLIIGFSVVMFITSIASEKRLSAAGRQQYVEKKTVEVADFNANSKLEYKMAWGKIDSFWCPASQATHLGEMWLYCTNSSSDIRTGPAVYFHPSIQIISVNLVTNIGTKFMVTAKNMNGDYETWLIDLPSGTSPALKWFPLDGKVLRQDRNLPYRDAFE